MEVFFNIIWRVLTIVALFVLVALVMGKRHVGEFSVFDLVIAVTLGAVAGADLADPDVPHLPTVLAIVALALVHFGVSRLVIGNRLAGKYLTLDPTVIIQNGRILVDNLSKTRYSVDEMMSHLRAKGVFELGEVEFAVLEPHGELSVLKKSQHRQVTPQDLKTATAYEGLPSTVVLEGEIQRDALHALNLSDEWLLDTLQSMGYSGPEQIFLAQISTRGSVYVSEYKSVASAQKVSH